MANITKTAPLGANADAGVALTFTAADTTVQTAEFRAGDLLLAWNSGGSPRTVTVYSAANRSGRTNDITAEAIAVGAIRMYGPFTREGWKQDANELHFSGSHSDVKFAVIKA